MENRTVGSVAERPVHIGKVIGSIPIPSTKHMKKNILIVIAILVVVFAGIIYFFQPKRAAEEEEIKSLNILDLNFKYDEDLFSLKEEDDKYQFKAGEGPTLRGYTLIPSEVTSLKGNVNGTETQLFVLFKGSGANIIEPILFAFIQKNGDWRQLDSVKFPPDGGRTTIDRFYLEDNAIVLEVKTSGPDKNYHETYVPKKYVYEIADGELVLTEGYEAPESVEQETSVMPEATE